MDNMDNNNNMNNNPENEANEQPTVNLRKEVPENMQMPAQDNVPPMPPQGDPAPYGNNPYSSVAPTYFSQQNGNNYGYNDQMPNYGAPNTPPPPPPYGVQGQPPYGVPGQMPPPAYAQYPNNNYIYNNQVNQQNNKDVPGLIFGLASIVLISAPFIGAILGGVGLGLSSSAKKRAASVGLPQSSNSKAGFVCSLIGLIVNIILTLFIVATIVLAVVFGTDESSSKSHGKNYQDNYGYHYYYDDDDLDDFYDRYFT